MSNIHLSQQTQNDCHMPGLGVTAPQQPASDRPTGPPKSAASDGSSSQSDSDCDDSSDSDQSEAEMDEKSHDSCIESVLAFFRVRQWLAALLGVVVLVATGFGIWGIVECCKQQNNNHNINSTAQTDNNPAVENTNVQKTDKLLVEKTNVQNTDNPAHPVPDLPTGGEKGKVLVVFDFDCTLSAKHMYSDLHHPAGEYKTEEQRMAAVQNVDFVEKTFGGSARIDKLKEFLQELVDLGAVLKIASFGITKQIEEALKTAGLFELFDEIHGRASPDPKLIYDKPKYIMGLVSKAGVDANGRKPRVIFADDDAGNYEGLLPPTVQTFENFPLNKKWRFEKNNDTGLTDPMLEEIVNMAKSGAQ